MGRISIHEVVKEVNDQRGKAHYWPACFDYNMENGCATIEANKQLTKKEFRRLDSWGLAFINHAKERTANVKVSKISFIVKGRGQDFELNFEAFKRRVSYLNINNEDMIFEIICNKEPVSLYNKQALFNRPPNELIRDFINDRGDTDKGCRLEKDFQAFLYGYGFNKGEGSNKKEDRTNDRLAIIGEHFFKVKQKKMGILREFPTGVFINSISKSTQLLPTEFVDIVTLNKWDYLSVIELKLDDSQLEVVSQLLDYALFFGCYADKLFELIREKTSVKPKRKIFYCYVVNNYFHNRFDEVFKFYSTQGKSYNFKMFKVVLGAITE